MTAEFTIGSIIIERSQRPVVGADNCFVVIDGMPQGELPAGETREYFVDPGAHSVCFKMNGAVGRPVEVNVSNSERIILNCRPLDWLHCLSSPRAWLNPSERMHVTVLNPYAR